MLVSKTDTTMSLSSLTSESTLLTAASNSVVLFKSCQQKKTHQSNQFKKGKRKPSLFLHLKKKHLPQEYPECL